MSKTLITFLGDEAMREHLLGETPLEQGDAISFPIISFSLVGFTHIGRASWTTLGESVTHYVGENTSERDLWITSGLLGEITPCRREHTGTRLAG